MRKQKHKQSLHTKTNGVDTYLGTLPATSGVGGTYALLSNFSVRDISAWAKKTHVKSIKSYSYLTVATTAELWWHLSNMNVISKWLTVLR